MKLSVRQKLLLGGLLLLLLAVLGTATVLGISAVTSGETTLRAESENKLTAIRDTKRQQIEDYFANSIAVVKGLATTPTVIDAVKNFSAATATANDELKLGAAEAESRRKKLEEFYGKTFGDEFTKVSGEKSEALASIATQADAVTQQLQYLYIVANSNPLGEKNKLNNSIDSTSYSKFHALYHPGLEGMRSQIGFYDVFLFDMNGRVVYTAFKEIDFMSNLEKGVAADTGLSEVFKTLKTAKPGDIHIADFKRYLPSYNAQAGFLGTPIFDGAKQIGILAVQLPLDQISRVMTSNRKWKETGQGTSGETYLIGADGLMRSDSRFVIETKPKFIENYKAKDAKAAAEADRRNTTVGIVKIATEGGASVQAGKTGFAEYPDYLGNPVLGAFTPVTVPGLRWGLIAEIDVAEALAPAETLRNDILRNALLTAFGLLLIGLLFTYVFGSRFLRPIEKLTSTVNKLSAGDYSARSQLTTGDEMEALSKQFDGMLDERIATLAAAQQENETLNDSIVGLLEGVFRLSQRDLTVKVPVKEDVTGSLADALNALSKETSDTLHSVVDSANEVESASNRVKSQADEVILLAAQERQEVDKAQLALTSAVDAMKRIEQLSRTSNDAAQSAIQASSSALASVQNTVSGMDGIRETMRETEKRMKRLSERSQEISSVVSLINTISERTHVLAINANMQAAMAGEAGKGFAVVAAEVQSLAENARQATAQIAQLVNNIQVETSDTIATMNNTVSQVVEGSKLAQQAGQQMIQTQQATSNLVELVGAIDEGAQQQSAVAQELLVRAESIRNSTQKTGTQLAAQARETRTLVEYAEKLRDSVNVFTLPEKK
jgi:methyl-accepting chemotaxis protein